MNAFLRARCNIAAYALALGLAALPAQAEESGTSAGRIGPNPSTDGIPARRPRPGQRGDGPSTSSP